MPNNLQKKCEHIWNRAVTVGFKDRICGLCGAIEPMPTSTESTTKYANGLLYSSPTQPENVSKTCITDKKLDTESWEEEFKRKFPELFIATKTGKKKEWMWEVTEPVEMFIHQVSEKAYQRGQNECRHSDIFVEMREKEARQSAYREIIQVIEDGAYKSPDDCEIAINAAFLLLKEKIKEKLSTNQK